MIPRDVRKPKISAKILGEPKNGTSFLKYRRGIGILTKKYRKTPKNAYFVAFHPPNDIFKQSRQLTPPLKFLLRIFYYFFFIFHKMLTYDVILAPKMSQFWPFPPKMTYFDQIDPINVIFDQSYVNKPDWRNVSKFLE